MRSITNIIIEQEEGLTSTETALIASIAISPTPQMAYDTSVGTRKAVAARKNLERFGFVRVNEEARELTLTEKGEQVLVSQNLVDDVGELTERGEQLVAQFRENNEEWKTYEQFSLFGRFIG